MLSHVCGEIRIRRALGILKIKWPAAGYGEWFTEVGCQLKRVKKKEKKTKNCKRNITVNAVPLILVDYMVFSILGKCKHIKNKISH